MKDFIPPSFLIIFVPGLSERMKALEMIAFAPSSESCLGLMNLAVAFVATGMKKGVSIVPDFVLRVAIRAWVDLSLWVILNVMVGRRGGGF